MHSKILLFIETIHLSPKIDCLSMVDEILYIYIFLQIVSMGRKKFSADFQLMFRLLKMFLFIGFLVTIGIMFTFLSLTVGDIFSSLLAFLPTGWALLQVHIAS